ncbi:PAS domain-containing protein [Haloarchaeobius amylolyticus]|uniref:PAS domain-containing protein n=1 Tax=Haloarchaeobius amylolyticus TaxID=1198296 RepID=A0ABD6BJL0_9EURY
MEYPLAHRMTQPTATTRPRPILYVAASEATASEGAERLETVESGSGPGRSVRPATTIERVENWAPAVDCVVFAETPTTAAGANLLEVVAACGSTPVVLFADGSFTPGAARSTDGIDGYVRRDTDDAMVHLADEIEWVCRDEPRCQPDRDRLQTVVAALPFPALWYEREDGEHVVRAATDAVADVFGTDPDEVVGDTVDEWLVPSGLEHRQTTLREALQAGKRSQFERRHDTVDGVREFRVTLVPLEATATDDTVTGDAAGVLVYHDVTELHRSRRARAAADARLEGIADALDNEVWPPLNVARNYLDLAADTGNDEHVATVADAQERVEERLERVAAIAAEDRLVEPEPVGVHDIARRAWIGVDTGDTRLVTQNATDRVLAADTVRLRELFECLFRLVVADGPVPAVVVDVTADGFYLTQYDPDVDTEATVDLETEPDAAESDTNRSAALNGADGDLETVERIADAHGWSVDVVETNGRIAVVCRGVADGERALDGI